MATDRDTDTITLALLERSPRMRPEWLESLPAWRDAFQPGRPLVDVLIDLEVLHSPARMIVDLVGRGVLQEAHVPVLITALGARRLGVVMRQPIAEPAAADERDWDGIGSGEFIPLAAESMDTDADESDDIDWDTFSPGEFISFDSEEEREDDDVASTSSSTDKHWESYGSGEFIDFNSR